ncbi:MAG TPA: AAA family ATPase [archaeon]|nr:AAA family ATPase [archaeon]HPV66116.1 AAA family ATPase [archaeon]
MAENIFYTFLNENSVFTDKSKISPHYAPEKLPFRDEQIKDLSLWLSPVLKKAKPHNIFVYGKVGTGKTTVVRHVMSQLELFAKDQHLPLLPVYLNCRNYQTKYTVLVYCVQLFYPDQNFFGYSRSFIYDKFLTYIKENKINFVVVLDEIDKIKDKEIDDLIYTLTRANDELEGGSVSIIGISNNLFFKNNLDSRTKSSLCEQEAVYPPYNAEELRAILNQRIDLAFKKDVVSDSAINAAAAIAAKESGDARRAVMLLLRAGEIADIKGHTKVTDKEVYEAKEKVEQEVMKSMVLTLPIQLQLVLFAIAQGSLKPKGVIGLTGQYMETNILHSGEIYDKYCALCNKYSEKAVTIRWFREYINELETYGFISTTISGKGVKGNTTLIRLGIDAQTIIDLLKSEFSE